MLSNSRYIVPTENINNPHMRFSINSTVIYDGAYERFNSAISEIMYQNYRASTFAKKHKLTQLEYLTKFKVKTSESNCNICLKIAEISYLFKEHHICENCVKICFDAAEQLENINIPHNSVILTIGDHILLYKKRCVYGVYRIIHLDNYLNNFTLSKSKYDCAFNSSRHDDLSICNKCQEILDLHKHRRFEQYKLILQFATVYDLVRFIYTTLCDIDKYI